MTFLAILFLAFAMSTDAFVVSICRGVSLKSTSFFSAIKMGLLFGFVEALTPLVGWLLGNIALYYVERWGNWIVFSVMFFLGSKMMVNSFQKEEVITKNNELIFTKNTFFTLTLAALSTSIDGFVIGVGLGLANMNIWLASSMFGIITCIMCLVGLLLGKKIGLLIGKLAEFLGGMVLIVLGIIAFN